MHLYPPPSPSGLKARDTWVSHPRRSNHRGVVLEQLVGAAGRAGGATVPPTPGEEKVLDPGGCALSMERPVDGRLDTCVPPGLHDACVREERGKKMLVVRTAPPPHI